MGLASLSGTSLCIFYVGVISLSGATLCIIYVGLTSFCGTSFVKYTGDSFQFLGLKGKGSFYIAQYPICWTVQSALQFLPSLADLFIPTRTRLLREAF